MRPFAKWRWLHSYPGGTKSLESSISNSHNLFQSLMSHKQMSSVFWTAICCNWLEDVCRFLSKCINFFTEKPIPQTACWRAALEGQQMFLRAWQSSTSVNFLVVLSEQELDAILIHSESFKNCPSSIMRISSQSSSAWFIPVETDGVIIALWIILKLV